MVREYTRGLFELSRGVLPVVVGSDVEAELKGATSVVS